MTVRQSPSPTPVGPPQARGPGLAWPGPELHRRLDSVGGSAPLLLPPPPPLPGTAAAQDPADGADEACSPRFLSPAAAPAAAIGPLPGRHLGRRVSCYAAAILVSADAAAAAAAAAATAAAAAASATDAVDEGAADGDVEGASRADYDSVGNSSLGFDSLSYNSGCFDAVGVDSICRQDHEKVSLICLSPRLGPQTSLSS